MQNKIIINDSKTEERRFMYNLLSETFGKKPEKEFLNKFKIDGLFEFLSEYIDDKKIINQLELTIDELLEDDVRIKNLADIYENMFVVPAAAKFIPPVASSFIDAEKENKIAENVQLSLIDELYIFYERYNVKFVGGEKNNFVFHIDHVSALFNFMVLLIDLEKKHQCESNICNKIFNDEAMFFNKFIFSWADKFFSEVILKSDALFYSEVSKIASIFLNSESTIKDCDDCDVS
ncbi:MAG: TorD/DmsD family molecular chaperone [bacterium]